MSTPEQPGLTRKQIREIRKTGALPVIGAEGDAPEPDDVAQDVAADAAPVASAAPAAPPAPAVHLPRAAVPVVAAPAPPPDEHVDLGASPLTRKQARNQERIRTASVPVIAAEGDTPAGVAEQADARVEQATAAEAVVEHEHDAVAEPAGDDGVVPVPMPEARAERHEPATAVDDDDRLVHADHSGDTEAAGAVLRPGFGETVLADAPPAPVVLTPSFDDLIARTPSTAGSASAPSALILTQPQTGPLLTAPITATGEVFVTGSLNLPAGLGSQGHAHGTADGKEADAVLLDGELPAASSPTPIAASAAISTVKGAEELIRPPAPEKGNRLMLTLAITAGVLAIALVGVLILGFVTGVL